MNLEERIQHMISLGLRFNGEDAYILQDIYVPVLDLKTLEDADFTELRTAITNHIASNPDKYPQPQYAVTAIVTAPEEQPQEETIIDKALTTLSSGTQILQGNKVSSDSAKKAARALIDKIKTAGMNPAVYEEVVALRKKISVTVTTLNERRKPFTQAMDLIKTEFTTCENELKETQQGTEAYELKLFADDWVKKCAIEKKRQEDEIEAKRLKNQEIIDRKAAIEKSLVIYFNDYLAGKKQTFSNRFNAITLDNYEAESKFFTTVPFQYAKEHFDLFKYNTPSQRLTSDEQQEIVASIVTEDKYKELCTLYFDAMTALRVEKVDLLTSKRNELERIREFEIEQEKERLENERIDNERKNASAARQKELDQQKAILEQQEAERKEKQRIIEEQQAIRFREEQAELEKQKQQQLEAAQSQVEVKAAQDTTSNLFASQADATNITVSAPKTKTGYEVEVLTPVAWLEVFNFWFQNEGAGWEAEKLRKKFDFMLTFMEKTALKSGTMLESTNIKYHETYAAKK